MLIPQSTQTQEVKKETSVLFRDRNVWVSVQDGCGQSVGCLSYLLKNEDLTTSVVRLEYRHTYLGSMRGCDRQSECMRFAVASGLQAPRMVRRFLAALYRLVECACKDSLKSHLEPTDFDLHLTYFGFDNRRLLGAFGTGTVHHIGRLTEVRFAYNYNYPVDAVSKHRLSCRSIGFDSYWVCERHAFLFVIWTRGGSGWWTWNLTVVVFRV